MKINYVYELECFFYEKDWMIGMEKWNLLMWKSDLCNILIKVVKELVCYDWYVMNLLNEVYKILFDKCLEWNYGDEKWIKFLLYIREKFDELIKYVLIKEFEY